MNENNNQFNINPQSQILNNLNQVQSPIQNNGTTNQVFNNNNNQFNMSNMSNFNPNGLAGNNNQVVQTSEPILPNPLINNQQGINLEPNQPVNNVIPETNINQNIQPININGTNNPNYQNVQGNQIPINNQPVGNIANNNNYPQNNFNETSINNLNVNGTYNNMQKPDYVQEPLVRENIQKSPKKTVTIPSEMKTVIVIALILLIFIFAMPYIFEFVRNIKY